MTRAHLMALGIAALISASAVGLDDDSNDNEGEGDLACPCSKTLTFIKTRPGDTTGTGGGRSVITTAQTWTASDTWTGTSSNAGKVGASFGGGVLPSASIGTAYTRTVTEESGTGRQNEQPQAIVEYSDFTFLTDAGACYSYVEQEKCSDDTYEQCGADISFKVTFHNGPANQDYVDIGTVVTDAKVSRGPKPAVPDVRLDTPGQCVPILKSAMLDCGTHSQFYITSYEPASYRTPTISVSVKYDFGYRFECGACPEKPSDG